ncbi:MAG: phosphodiester glycosidase family protein [Patescibacteria group bacterium]|jgi:uncharacterized protein YigE (DUF2233 family)
MIRRSILGVVLATTVLFGAGCVSIQAVRPEDPLLPPPEWVDVGFGAARREATVGSRAAKGSLILYRFPAKGFSWRFEHSTSSLSVREWAARFPEAAFLTNGVYFHEDNMPSGLLITKGERVGDRVFDDTKSGIIQLAPEFRIIDSSKEKITSYASFTEAAQSYPFLIQDGEGAVAEDTGKFAERTFIGTDRSGDIYVGVLLNEPVSLFELMELIAAQPVEWKNVINLDGGASTGYAAAFPNENEGRNSLTPVPNVIVVTPKP